MPIQAIITNGLLLLFEVGCIAAWKIRQEFGSGDFAAPVERVNLNLTVLGLGRRLKERKEGRMGDERTWADLFPWQVMTRPTPPGLLPGSSN